LESILGLLKSLKILAQVQADAEVAGRARCSVHRGPQQHRYQLQEEQVGRKVHLKGLGHQMNIYLKVYKTESVLLVHAPL
jgi:hypothetical protein